MEWALRRASELGLLFDGSPAAINRMIQSELSVEGDIYLDFDVSGNIVNRPALTALLKRIQQDKEVSAVFIPRRDRLVRPDDPTDGVQLENLIRRCQVAIHYLDKTLPPLIIGERVDIAEQITAVIEYDQSGKFRREIADKMIPAQTNLAQQGFSTGGRAPFFLDRWLLDSRGTPVRKLVDGEIVRMAGHHVAWLPGPPEKMALAIRIFEMLEKMPASQAARILTEEGIPLPDAGRRRTDRSQSHFVSGAWHGNTLVDVVRGLKLVGKVVYGRRSMGDQKRISSNGPRSLGEEDFREEQGKLVPKIIQNPKQDWIVSPGHYQPPVSEERLSKLIAELDRRGESQRGKPRSKDTDNNPLGVRVFDTACGWPMYREPYGQGDKKTYRYKCGAYTQSHGAMCKHNHVPGPQTALFAMNAIRQRLCSPTLQQKIRARLEALAAQERHEEIGIRTLANKQIQLKTVQDDIQLVQQNLARVRTDSQFLAISTEFDKLKEREKILTKELSEIEKRQSSITQQPEKEIAAAFGLLDRLTTMAQAVDNRILRELFELTNTRLFLRFETEQWGKRQVQNLKSGMITFGDTPPPIKLYEGRTGRSALKEAITQDAADKTPSTHHGGGCIDSVVDEEENSLGNASRGDSPCTFVNETTGSRLVRAIFPQSYAFKGDAVLRLVKSGLYSKQKQF